MRLDTMIGEERAKAIYKARLVDGLTWKTIGKSHKVCSQRAMQIYVDYVRLMDRRAKFLTAKMHLKIHQC